MEPRIATIDDAKDIAEMLDAFNTEFGSATPGAKVLEERLLNLLQDKTFAVLVGEPAVGLALVTLRTNVWYDGPVALLDELYVSPDQRNKGIGSSIMTFLGVEAKRTGVSAIEINVDESDTVAQRFYERHGYSLIDSDSGERAFYLSREL